MTDIYLFYAVVALGLYAAWNIGANDVANAMGTSVGSKAITFKQAILLAGIFELIGAVFVGGNVTKTISKGIVQPDIVPDISIFIVGMMSVLLASSIWLNIATRFGLPVSTTHSIVGAVMGFGVIAGGFGSINWKVAGSIVASWVISPLAGGIISFLLFWYLLRRVIAVQDSVAAIKKTAPYLVFAVGMMLTLSMLFKGLKNLGIALPFGLALLYSFGVGVVAFFIGKLWVSRLDAGANGSFASRTKATEKIFSVLQVITACYVAFSHGSNDVANAIGPVAAVVEGLKTGSIAAEVPVPFWVLSLGGLGIVIGLATYGGRVIKTIGQKKHNHKQSRGFAAEFGCATTVLVCSKLGLPVSTTHTLIGALVGVGFARGIGAINMKSVRSIVASWLWTIPFTAGLTMIVFLIARAFLLP